MAPRRFNMMLLGVFAGVALVLAAVGLYGVMSYSVSWRTHEIGIRMALGAKRADVLRLVVRQGMSMTFIGLVLGLIGAFFMSRVLVGFALRCIGQRSADVRGRIDRVAGNSAACVSDPSTPRDTRRSDHRSEDRVMPPSLILDNFERVLSNFDE